MRHLCMTTDTIQVGNLCVFKFGKSWKIGHVLQFAKYKKEAKKYNIPYKGCSANVLSLNVGVLCSWYEQLHGSQNSFQISQKNIDFSYQPITAFLCLLPEESLNPVDSPVSSKETCNQSIPELSQQQKVCKSI